MLYGGEGEERHAGERKRVMEVVTKKDEEERDVVEATKTKERKKKHEKRSRRID